jgi:hypothetical protein
MSAGRERGVTPLHGFNKDIFIILSVRFALGELSAKGGEGKGSGTWENAYE